MAIEFWKVLKTEKLGNISNATGILLEDAKHIVTVAYHIAHENVILSISIIPRGPNGVLTITQQVQCDVAISPWVSWGDISKDEMFNTVIEEVIDRACKEIGATNQAALLDNHIVVPVPAPGWASHKLLCDYSAETIHAALFPGKV